MDHGTQCASRLGNGSWDGSCGARVTSSLSYVAPRFLFVRMERAADATAVARLQSLSKTV